MNGDGRTIEVCREFLHDHCKRSVEGCKFAHPPPHVEIVNGRVTCCVDSLRDRCTRNDPPCRYLHPPQHLKEQLLMSGRNSRGMNSMPSSSRGSYGGGSSMRGGSGDGYGDDFVGINPFYSQQDLFSAAALLQQSSWTDMPDRPAKSNCIEVCRQFLRGQCTRDLEECKFAHPPPSINVGSDNTVTVCMDFIRGQCGRTNCRYFHAPPHLEARIRRGGMSGGSSGLGRKRSYQSDYRNGDEFESSAKRLAADDFYD